MALYDSGDVTYFSQRAEEDLCRKFNLVVDRYVLPIVANIYLYDIPEYCYSLRRITYRGRKLNPYSGTEQILSGSTPQNYSRSEPREYIYNFLGKKKIRLFPTPAETLNGTGDPWTGATIRDKCIMEFYRIPDFNDEYKRIPSWIRGQLTETLAYEQLTKMDNQGFSIKAIKFYQKKVEKDESNLETLKSLLFRSVFKVMSPQPELNRTIPARPKLPWNFGVRVD